MLLDSHSLIWAVDDPSQLSQDAAFALRDPANDVFVSAATIWELAIKCGLGRLKLSVPYRRWMEQAVVDLGAEILPINIQYADVQASLPLHHRDPFDRLIVAQSQAEQIAVVSNDAVLDLYGIQRVW